MGWTTSKGPLQPQSFHGAKNFKARSYQPRTCSDTEKPNSAYAHIYNTCVFLYMHVVEKVMAHFGHELKISEVGISLEDMIPVGKAVIPTAVFLWQPIEVVTSSHSFWVPVLAAPCHCLCSSSQILILCFIKSGGCCCVMTRSAAFAIRSAHFLPLNVRGSNAMKMPIIVSGHI